MFLFLDIGFTLIGGPNSGPARRLAEGLRLPATAKGPLSDLLFRTPFADAEGLAAALLDRFATPPEETRLLARSLWQAQETEAYPLPGAREWLEQLQEANIPFGFISNIWAPFYAGFARLFPAASQNRPAFLSFRLGMAKPDLQLYRMAMEQVGVTPEETIMIGDTYEMDIAPPRQLGIKTVWVLHRPQQELADTLQIVNGLAPPPDLAVAQIGQLRVEQLHALLKESTPHAG
jgi:HAD superfamily hydrolase (TIGR01509 family)